MHLREQQQNNRKILKKSIKMENGKNLGNDQPLIIFFFNHRYSGLRKWQAVIKHFVSILKMKCSKPAKRSHSTSYL